MTKFMKNKIIDDGKNLKVLILIKILFFASICNLFSV